ncbi:MAG: hydroxymethylbilane synthase [Leptospirales bacterium]|nr:hydroxymethylbilane synthase [Leptospirales bacterium]
MKIRIGTRGSDLAMIQARYVADRLKNVDTEIVVISTKGDQIQNVSFNKMEGKGFFTKEIEDALLNNVIDLAVHSLKDLPTDITPGLTLVAVPPREDPSDVILVRKEKAAEAAPFPLIEGAVVGTSSIRRLAQLKSVRHDLDVRPLRGNVNTRLRRLAQGDYDAIILASAGLNRLKIDVSEFLAKTIAFDVVLPSPGQGALGLEVRSGDIETIEAVLPLNDKDSMACVSAERAFLQGFGGGCNIPLGALALTTAGGISLDGLIAAPDGSVVYRATVLGSDPVETGKRLAETIKKKGSGK